MYRRPTSELERTEGESRVAVGRGRHERDRVAPRRLVGRNGALEVAPAPRRGRDAADDEIARRVAADDDPSAITVVTSDAALADRVRAAGASVEGARTF